ncbi:MAG: DRTGG domain-containing protein [Oscillospiraceae bacterium]
MTVSELIVTMNLTLISGAGGLDREAHGCYIGDLLSLAMSKVQQDYVWITIQTNINIVAVASLADASCIIIADGFRLDENAIAKADIENIPIMSSDKSAYALAAELSALKI